jgi:hypothetical protein
MGGFDGMFGNIQQPFRRTLWEAVTRGTHKWLGGQGYAVSMDTFDDNRFQLTFAPNAGERRGRKIMVVFAFEEKE